MLLRDSIYQIIRRAILTCEFEPGQELREHMLAERYHVSRSPIRDALLRLELESLVTVLPRQGYLVRAISIPDVEALFDLRLLVTSACAARAANADDAAVKKLERFRNYPSIENGEDAFLEYNLAFHYSIADICGNARLAAIEYDLAQQTSRLVRISVNKLQKRFAHEAISEHGASIDAIQAHDAETASRLAHDRAEVENAQIMMALRMNAQAEDERTFPP